MSHLHQAQLIRQSLSLLQQRIATTRWRGLLVIQASPSYRFNWPQHALVLTGQLKDFRQHLGSNQHMVVVDMRQSLHADALAASVPTVQAKGIAVVILPEVLTCFSRRLIANLPRHTSHHIQLLPITAPEEAYIDLSDLPMTNASTPRGISISDLNAEQTRAYQTILGHLQANRHAPVLLRAARGRGKSTVLGLVAQQLLKAGKEVTVSAPSKRQVSTLQSSCGQTLAFVAPDLLLAEHASVIDGVLLLDEAASLPSDMLERLIRRYPKVIMATTSEGYETCGRGFLLHFQRNLAERFDSFLELGIHQPVRFASDCPLEQWLHQSLLLAPQVCSYPSATSAQSNLSYALVHAAELPEAMLAQCFHLLMDAHYQTSPNDLKLLLDDNKHRLCLQYVTQQKGPQLSAVAWLSDDGKLAPELAEQVVAGTRRPPGNLLAQGLSQHMADPHIAMATWLRVVRIAVPEEIQQQGLGSVLLNHLCTEANAHYAGIGSSFSSHPAINRFWRQQGFLPVRLGARKDATTGKHALMMVKAVSPDWRQRISQWAGFFAHELNQYQKLYHLDEAYLASLQPLTLVAYEAYTVWARQRILAFINGQLDLQSAAPTIATLFPHEVTHNPILYHGVYHFPLSQQFKHEHRLTGRKMLQTKVRDICFDLLRAI